MNRDKLADLMGNVLEESTCHMICPEGFRDAKSR